MTFDEAAHKRGSKDKTLVSGSTAKARYVLPYGHKASDKG
jgi:hypothetical protein